MIQAAALWLALVTPSLLIVSRAGGSAGVVVYLTYAAGAVWAFTYFRRYPAARRVPALAVATAIALCLLFVAVYPRVNTHQPDRGSDDDDAYNTGVIALAHGQSPYAHQTYLGNPLAPMTGAYALAAPFVAIGTSAWQNVFWIVVFFVAVGRRDARDDGGSASAPAGGDLEDPGTRAMRLGWLVCAASADTIQNLVTGTAHVANTIYVALGLWWLVRTSRPRTVAALWGIALASRANFLMLVPLALAALARRHGWRAALLAIAAALTVMAALTVPFYLHDPAAFAPLYAAEKLQPFDEVLPHASVLIVVSMALVAVAAALTRLDGTRLFWKAALVQAVPILLGLAIGAWARGGLNAAYASYATFASWFVFLAISRRRA